MKRGYRLRDGGQVSTRPEQFYCLSGNDGVEWQKTASMPSYDKLPKKVRQAFAQSPFNICPVCFGEKMRQIKKLHPDWTKEKLMLAAVKVREEKFETGRLFNAGSKNVAAIEVMEAMVRKAS